MRGLLGPVTSEGVAENYYEIPGSMGYVNVRLRCAPSLRGWQRSCEPDWHTGYTGRGWRERMAEDIQRAVRASEKTPGERPGRARGSAIPRPAARGEQTPGVSSGALTKEGV